MKGVINMTSIYMMEENTKELTYNQRAVLNQLRKLFPGCSRKALQQLVRKATKDAQEQSAKWRAEDTALYGEEYGGCERYEQSMDYQIKGLTLRIDLTNALALYGEEFTKQGDTGKEYWWRDADGTEYPQRY